MTDDMLVKNKTIGILGGMGAAASARLYSEIVRISQETYGARRDCDFPPMLLYSLPLAGLEAGGLTAQGAEGAQSQLTAGVKKLEQGGSDFVVIPCNTVHYFYDAIQSAVNIPVLSLIEETVNEVARGRYGCVGVLCTKSTSKWGLYSKELDKRGIGVVAVNAQQQKEITQIIHRVIGGIQGVGDRRILQGIIQDLSKRGAEGVVLGCTELPLVISQEEASVRIFDTIRILAQTATAYSLD